MAYHRRDSNATRSLARGKTKEQLAAWYFDAATHLRSVLKVVADAFDGMSAEHRDRLLDAIDGCYEWDVPDKLAKERDKRRRNGKEG